MNQFTKLIAAQLNLKEQAVENTLALLEEGCTIPFISRYRKEKTGNMDEVNIEAIAQANEKLSEMAKRKETILKTIEEQGKLSDELKKRIEQCWDATELEDIYLPYKPKRRTRAQIAREAGLEPLAQLLLFQRERNPEQAARKFVGDKVKDVEAALQGAKDIIAETVSENEQSRNQIRGEFRRGAIITSKVVAKKKDEEEAQRFSDYFDFSEPLKKCSSHRLLAMRRGEAAGFLRVSISADDEQCQDKLKRHYVHGFGECQTLVGEAVDDAFKRLLKPSIETEFAALSKQKADEEAIVVFAENLRQLLQEPYPEYPYLCRILRELTELKQFTDDLQKRRLVVKVTSFAYKKGIPEDSTGNGGGFVFDCRAVNNPGKYERYKPFTGLDEPVIRFLEDDGEIAVFLEHAYALVDASVKRYMERGFTNLSVCFGCTGGQHRSVYSAQHLAEHLHKKFGVQVNLIHREQNIEQTFKAKV